MPGRPKHPRHYDAPLPEGHEEFMENATAIARDAAIDSIEGVNRLIELAHQVPNEGTDGKLVALVAVRLRVSLKALEDFLPEIESELLVVDTGPARALGIERRTAHSLSLALGKMMFTEITETSDPGAFERFALDMDFQHPPFDAVAVRERVRRFRPFDSALLVEMAKQESAQVAKAWHDRQEQAKRVEQLSRIDEGDRIRLSKTDAASYCLASVRTIDRWIASGKLHCALENDGPLFSKSELQIIRTIRQARSRPKEEPAP